MTDSQEPGDDQPEHEQPAAEPTGSAADARRESSDDAPGATHPEPPPHDVESRISAPGLKPQAPASPEGAPPPPDDLGATESEAPSDAATSADASPPMPGEAAAPAAAGSSSIERTETLAAPPPAPRWEPPQRARERYPMRFDVTYPDRLSRWKTFLRGFLIIPAYIFFAMIQYFVQIALALGWIPVFFKKKYPAWLFEAGTGALGFSARFSAYGLLLTDRYPSFDRESSDVLLEYDEPSPGQLSRWRVFFWKLFLLIPHFFVLSFLSFVVFAVTVIAWFAILFTGRYPRGMFGFVTGVLRWSYRVIGYFASYNDRFPPYSLSADAGPGANGAAIASGIVGVLLLGGCGTLIGVAAAMSDNANTEDIDYESLRRGVTSDTVYTGSRSDPTFTVRLDRVRDPADVLNTEYDGYRQVAFAWMVYNGTSSDHSLNTSDFRLRIDNGGDLEWVRPALVTVDIEPPPAKLLEDERQIVLATFVVPEDAQPVELRFQPPWPATGGVRYRFE